MSKDTGGGAYTIREDGAIISEFGHALTPKNNGFGYFRVKIGARHIMVHRLVWQYWRGPIPPGYQINHIDGNKANNAIENLEVVTPSENSKHSWSLKKRSRVSPKKLTRQQAERVRELGAAGFPRRMIKDMFGVCLACVRHIQTGRNHV